MTFRDRWRCFFAILGPSARGNFRLQQRLFVKIERVTGHGQAPDPGAS